MPRLITITTPNGVDVNITPQVQHLVSIGGYEDYDMPERNTFAEKFARKLMILAGPGAPAAVLDSLAPSIPADYHAHLTRLWSFADDEDDEDDDLG